MMAESQAPVAAVPAAKPAAGAPTPPPLAFADADGAKAWAKAVQYTTLGPAYEAVLGQLKAMASAEFAPRERATIAEMFREPVGHLHTELARRYAGKPQPAGEREAEAIDQAIALWQAMWEQYSACLKPLLEGDPELAGVKPKLLQRGLYVGKQLLLVHGLARRVPPESLWQELHAYYRLAEMLDSAVTAVSDDLVPHAVGISCYSTYSHALLLQLADPCAMTVRQIELCDRWLAQWARKVFPYAQQRETEGPVVVVDLDAPTGATLQAHAPGGGAPSVRYGYPGKLMTSVRGRLKRLASGASPAELQLGHDVSVEQCVSLLSHLDARWYQALGHDMEKAHVSLEMCAGGMPAVYFRVAGRTFDRQDPLGRLTYAGAQHIATIGALTDYDRFKEEAERNWPWERWRGQFDGRDASMVRRDDTRHRWFLEQLVIVRDEKGPRLGHIVRVALDPGREFAITLRLFAGTPKARAVRPLTHSFSEDPPLPVLLLSASDDDPPTLITPPRTFTAGRVLRSMDPGPEREYKLLKLLQRGGDFERVSFEEKH